MRVLVLAVACLSTAASAERKPYALEEPATNSEARGYQYTLRQCASGNGNWCKFLGAAHYNGYTFETTGEFVPQDFAKAAQFHRRGCKLGDVESCGLLGSLYAVGRGVEKDAVRAVQLWRDACDRDHASSCVNLGRYASAGTGGLEQSSDAAVEYYRRACALKDEEGCALVRSGGPLEGPFVESAMPKGQGWWCFAMKALGHRLLAGCKRTEPECAEQRDVLVASARERADSGETEISLTECTQSPRAVCYTSWSKVYELYWPTCFADFKSCTKENEYARQHTTDDFNQFSECRAVD